MNMTKCFCLAALLALTAGAFPFNIHAGKLTSLLRTTDAQDFVDTTEALKKNDIKPAEMVPDYMRKNVPPEEGTVYVILIISVEAGRSISIADYVLSADGTECECRGLASEKTDFFDPRCFKLDGPTTARLLFQCPENAENGDLLPAPGFPLAPVKNLVLFKKPEPEPVPAASEEASPAESAGADATVATEDKPTEDKSAEDKPAEEAKPAAEAKPAPAKAAAKPAAKPTAKPAEEAKPAAKPAEESKPAPKPADPKPAAKPAEAKPAPQPKQDDAWF